MSGARVAAEPSPLPRVGIFWIYRGEIFGASVGLRDAVATSLGIIDADIDHASFWEAGGSHRVRFPELVDAEYFEVPRGRVLFDQTTDFSVVYLDSTLKVPSARLLITNFFGLHESRTRWHLDPHYTMARDA